MKEIQLGDIRISYTQAGHGPPLVLLHGGMEDSRSWRQQIDGLSDEFTVSAWDAPGCGQSSDVPDNWRMSNYADALAGWLDKIALTHPIFLVFPGAVLSHWSFIAATPIFLYRLFWLLLMQDGKVRFHRGSRYSPGKYSCQCKSSP